MLTLTQWTNPVSINPCTINTVFLEPSNPELKIVEGSDVFKNVGWNENNKNTNEMHILTETGPKAIEMS